MLLAHYIGHEESLRFALAVLHNRSKIQMLLPVQTAAIGCHHHLCRGKTAGKDNLFKLILESLSRFYFEFRMKIEGAKITPFTRAHLAVKRSLDRIRAKRKD